jgi:hypothetical protein
LKLVLGQRAKRWTEEPLQRSRQPRQAEQSYTSIADGIREFNAKLLDIAEANTMASMNFVFELTRVNGRTEAF